MEGSNTITFVMSKRGANFVRLTNFINYRTPMISTGKVTYTASTKAGSYCNSWHNIKLSALLSNKTVRN
jgi:hypothetical protein